MLHIEKWKVILTVLLCVLGFAYAAPNIMSPETQKFVEEKFSGWLPYKTVSLGLDLQGGAHLLLEADIKSYIRERMESMKDAARTQLRKEGIGYTKLEARPDGVTITLRNPEDGPAAKKIAAKLEDLAAVDVTPAGVLTVTLDEVAMKDMTSKVINQSIEVVRNRVDALGTKEPLIQRQGSDRIVVQVPGESDSDRIKNILGRTAKLTFHLLDENAMSTGQAGADSMKLPMAERPETNLFVRRKALLGGERLVDAQPTFDQSGPAVSFRFDAIGSKTFCDISTANVGKPFAIVLDKKIISAPAIREPICNGSGQISGGFDVAEATNLALLLRSGALPAELKVVEERTVGPSLGSDSVASGKTAALAAFIAVFIFMLLSYGLFGIFADIALVLNLVFIFAMLSMLQATLTLPGIAAIILTIGIAVDANVLVYERVREELSHGRTVLSSIDTGYRHALRTIFDSNLTTLIVAMILFSFGSGPVKGFAVAMSIGIVTSLFSSIMVTRMIIIAWLRRTKPTTLHL
jgi:preprotein translocase subunit SecD